MDITQSIIKIKKQFITYLKKPLINYTFYFMFFFLSLYIGIHCTESGPGISPDSAKYIITGRNLAQGWGFNYGYDTDFLEIYAVWPPGYPILIMGGVIFGLSAEATARFIPLLSFSFLTLVVAQMGKESGGAAMGYLTGFLCLMLTPLVKISSMAWTEMPFIMFIGFSLLYLQRYYKNDDTESLLIAGVFTSLSTLTRYFGVTVFVTGGIIIFIRNYSILKEHIKRFTQTRAVLIMPALLLFLYLVNIREIVLFCLIFTVYVLRADANGSEFIKLVKDTAKYTIISLTLISVWIARNLYETGYITGMPRPSSQIGFASNLKSTLETITNDFLYKPFNSPDTMILNVIAGIFAIFTVIFIYSLIGNRFELSSINTVFKNVLETNLVSYTFVAVYLLTLNFMSTLWQYDSINTRLASPSYPFILITLASFFTYVVKTLKARPLIQGATFLIVLALYLSFSYLHISQVQKFQDVSSAGQQYNSPFWRNEQGIQWVRDNLPETARVYSDQIDIVRYRADRTVLWPPLRGDITAQEEFFQQINGKKDTYYLAFLVRENAKIMSNEEIVELNEVYNVFEVVQEFNTSIIYKVRTGG